MKIPNLRWIIAGLMVTASLLNYVDRTALAVASKTITDELHLSDRQYGEIVSAFLIAYTISYALGGMMVYRLGTRWGVGLSLIGWSLANMAHGWARTGAELMGYRFLLGLGEAVFFPAAMRGVAEWFQPRDRSKPIGMFLAGASLGAVVATPIVGTMMEMPGIGWRGAFVFTGALGLVLAPFWFWFYRHPADHAMLTPEEAVYLQGAAETAEIRQAWPLRHIFKLRAAWILIVTRFATDAAWYLMLFWLFRYFQTVRGFTAGDVARTNWIPFAMADVGALAGGWISAHLIRASGTPVRTRKALMFRFAFILPAALLGYLCPPDMSWLALGLCSAAAFGHMAYGVNSLSLHTDLFPPHTVGTMMGISGAAGSLGGVFLQMGVSTLVDSTHSYLPVFLAIAMLHPIAGTIVFAGLPADRLPEGPPESAEPRA